MDELRIHNPGDRIAIRFGSECVTLWEVDPNGTPVYRETVTADVNHITRPEPRFCTVRPKWCRLADGHDGGCQP